MSMLSVVSSTRELWQEVNFTELQKTLDSTVEQLAENRKSSESGRNSLITSLKDFRERASEEVRNSVSSLIKKFQCEVDRSKNRCVYAEDAYIAIYKKLVDLPDPSLALTEVHGLLKRANKTTELEAELVKHKESMEKLKAEVTVLRQHDSERSHLKKLIAEKANSVESQVQEKVALLKEQHDKVLREKEQDILMMQSEFDQKRELLEQKSLSLSKALELARSELYKLKTQADMSETGRSYEADMLVEELDKANAKIQSLEKALSSTLRDSTTSNETNWTNECVQLRNRVDVLELDLAQKEAEINNLLVQLKTVEQSAQDYQASTQAIIDELRSSLHSTEQKLFEAMQQLDKQSDYTQICRELNLLRSIEFPEESCEPADGNATQESSVKMPLETLLMNKNRNLENQLAKLSVENDCMKAELDRLRTSENDSRQQLQEQSELINLLESDLYRLQMVTCATRSPDHSLSIERENTPPAGLEGQLLTEAIGESDRKDNFSTVQTDSSLLQIVQNQRDRFRTRVAELEQTEMNLRQQLTVVQREAESFRLDNVKLYEKIRFLQSYTSSSSPKLRYNQSDSVAIQLHSDTVVNKYSQAYEAKLDPFNQFSHLERQRHYQRLRPHEKILLSLGRLVVSNRRARFFAFLYALVLHLLVFLVLYNSAHYSDSLLRAETSCMQRYSEHMRSAHKLTAANAPSL